MTRTVLRGNTGGAQIAQGQSIPAPVGGWDAKNPLSAMPDVNAPILDNWIPRPGFVELRRGYTSQVAGFTAPVESLMAYRGLPSGDRLFAASGGKIYDVSTAGTLGAAVYSGATSNRWNYVNFPTAGVEWIIACTGSDTPAGFNGSSWTAMSFTGGPTAGVSSLFNVFSHKGRLYYMQQGTLSCWVPAAGAIQGALTQIDLTNVFSKGGRLIAGGNWSYQFGVTADDFAVFMTDQGQIAIYQGTDPTNASTWSLVGVYDFGPPLGPKALIKYGGDLAVLTVDGVIPLSQGLKLERAQQEALALTNNIMNAFGAAVRAYKGNFGWQGVLYPGATASTNTTASGGSLAIFNIPVQTLGTSMQFVQNVLTGAWCRLLNLDAFCWELANGGIYFGTTNGVYQWDNGSSDAGTPIVGDVKSAFNNFGIPGREKRFTAIRPILNTTPLVAPALEVDVDYGESVPTAVPVVVQSGANTQTIRYDWTGATGVGYVGAARMQVNLAGDQAASPLLAVDNAANLLGVDAGLDTLFIQSALPFDVPCQLLGFDVLFQLGGSL